MVDQDGNEPLPALSRAISDSARDAGLFASMRRMYTSYLLYGCGVLSACIDARKNPHAVVIGEIRNLQPSSFSQPAPAGDPMRCITPNPLMPGLVVRDNVPEAWQIDPYTNQLHKLENWNVIVNPAIPEQPFGKAYCLPVYPELDSIAVAEAALDASVQRRGAPQLVLKIMENLPESLNGRINDITSAAASFVKDWGMVTGGVLPRGVEPANLASAIIDGNDARDRLLDLDARLDAFFSPASALSPGRSDQQALFGASQASRAQVWRAHIASEQAWLEDAYERVLMSIGLLAANSCADEWRLEIRLERPSEEDHHQQLLAELQLAISAGAIGKQELRERLDVLDLAEELPEDLIGLPQQVGNVEAPTLMVPEAPVPEDVDELAERHKEAADVQDEALIQALKENAARWKPRLQAWIKAQRELHSDAREVRRKAEEKGEDEPRQYEPLPAEN